MDTRDMSSDGTRRHSEVLRSFPVSASASSVSRVMLGDTRGGEDEAEGEGGRNAAHVAVIVLMGQIASVTNELSARGWLPWDGRRVYHAPTSSSLQPD